MVFVGFEGAAFALHFDAADYVGHFALVEDHGPVGGQVRDQASALDDVGAEIGFELGLAGEHHDGVKLVLG